MTQNLQPDYPLFDSADPKLIFLKTDQETYHYYHLYSFAARLQNQIDDIEREIDQPVLILADNRIETVFLIAALFCLKVPVMPLHPDTTGNELQEVFARIRPFAFYSDSEKSHSLLEGIPDLSISNNMIGIESDFDLEMMKADRPEKLAGYFLTSGSTGQPKIVTMKRRQVFFAADASSRQIKPDGNKFWLLCLPLNHVGGISVILRSLLYNSGIYLHPSFDPEAIRDLLYHDSSVEAASMVPTMLERLLEDSFFRAHFDFKSILLGGGPISMDLINRSLTRGLPIVCSYGMTETCAQIAANPMLRPSGTYIPKNSVGSIFEPNRIQIRSDEGEVLLPNESGKIWLKGPQVFDGYLDDSLNHNAFDRDGWFNTGDFGHINRRGHLFIESRRSDLIITGGENVVPDEIESILNSLEPVRRSAVIGVPDPKWGEKIVAFIEPADSDNPPDSEQLKTAVGNRVRSFKIPKDFFFIDKIPVTDTEKIRRKELLKIYGDRTSKS